MCLLPVLAKLFWFPEPHYVWVRVCLMVSSLLAAILGFKTNDTLAIVFAVINLVVVVIAAVVIYVGRMKRAPKISIPYNDPAKTMQPPAVFLLLVDATFAITLFILSVFMIDGVISGYHWRTDASKAYAGFFGYCSSACLFFFTIVGILRWWRYFTQRRSTNKACPRCRQPIKNTTSLVISGISALDSADEATETLTSTSDQKQQAAAGATPADQVPLLSDRDGDVLDNKDLV